MSPVSEQLDIFRGLFAHIAQDSLLQSHLGDPPRIYDAAPEDPDFPYLTYGTMRTTDISGDSSPLHSHSVSLHLWSRYAGRKEVLDIQDALSARFEFQSLTIDGHSVIAVTQLYRDVFVSSDGRTRHGVLRLNIITEPH